MSPFASLLSPLRALLVAAAALVLVPLHAQTMVRMHTTHGPLDMTLLDSQAPATVANFLAYVRGGDYVNDFFHRSAWLTNPATPFVIQGGGFTWGETGGIVSVPSRGSVVNEFSATRSNVRGTVAMAKLGSDPNSATSQWFVNMRDNAGNLDNQNGGFTVFARVTAPGMVTADRIANLQRVNAGAPLNEMPVYNWQGGTTITRGNVVLISSVTEFPASPGTNDRIFNYLEAAYPQYAAPSNGAHGSFDGYDYRFYAGTNVYVGIKDNTVWYLMPSIDNGIHSLGAVADWLGTAQAAGY